MDCAACGQPLIPNATFCSRCGKPVAGRSPGLAPGPAPPASGLAIVSLVFGIVSWVAVPLLGSLVAIITGHLARGEVKRSGGRVGGGGMAVAGLILGYTSVALLCTAIVGIALATALSGNIRELFSTSANDLADPPPAQVAPTAAPDAVPDRPAARPKRP